MSKELKPCPFCGSENAGVKEDDENSGMIWIICRDCGSMGEWDYSVKKAKQHWNRRANDEQL